MSKFAISAALAAMLFTGIFTTGCQTSHTETDKPTLFGGHKHEEITTTKNPITGETNVQHSESKTGL